jgi:uncharacterized protein (UPF0548 family)
MLSLKKPSTESIRRFIGGQRDLGFTYSFVGATAATPPADFIVDHTRVQIGTGEQVFDAAKAALERWAQFRLNWLEACPADTPIRTGEVVAVLAHTAGLWWLNACRIVYAIKEAGPITKFGFAYGTLPDHAATGEERFLIEWNRVDDSVWYDILAFSRPRHLLARFGYPFIRLMQKRFGRESAAAVLRAVGSRSCP